MPRLGGVACDRKDPPLGGFLPYSAQAGFTLVELIVTLLIIGIMAVVVLPRWQGDTGLDEVVLRDRTIAILRYAQKSAIAARRTVCATVSNSPTPQVTLAISNLNGAADCSDGVVLNGPDGAEMSAMSRGKATFASTPTIIFDAAGRASAATIAITGLAGGVTVEAETGYVH